MAEQVGCDDREVLGQAGHDLRPGRRVRRDAVNQHHCRAGSGPAIGVAVAMQGDTAKPVRLHCGQRSSAVLGLAERYR